MSLDGDKPFSCVLILYHLQRAVSWNKVVPYIAKGVVPVNRTIFSFPFRLREI